MFSIFSAMLKRSPAIYLWVWWRLFVSPPRSQSNEAEILEGLIANYAIPESFVEFGFGACEFNCARLLDRFEGLLIDGDHANVRYARKILRNTRVSCLHQWITLDTLGVVEDFTRGHGLGILSVDVDGNDFWFLRKLIPMQPAVIVCEFNRAFGDRLISVPYDEHFERFEKHASGLYFGASLAAIDHLCRSQGYVLKAISSNGINAFFVRGDLLPVGDLPIDSLGVAGSTPGSDRFAEVAALPFVDVTRLEPTPQPAGHRS